MKLVITYFLLSLFSICCRAQVNLSQGLIAYYPFNGNTNDVSGNGNHAINYGAVLSIDKWGNTNSAYYFNGVNNWMRILNSPSTSFSNDTFSVSALVCVKGFYFGLCHSSNIVDRGNYDNNPGAFAFRYCDNYITNGNNCNIPTVDTLHQNFYPLTTPIYVPSPFTPQFIQKDDWYCIVLVKKGSYLKTYVNGILDYDANVAGSFTTSNEDMFIGRHNSAQYPYWLTGILDEIRIYNRALNMQEIDSLCNYIPSFTAYANQDTICAGDSVMINAFGANNYSCTGGVTVGIPFAPLLTTTYTVTGTNANNVTFTTTITITVNPAPNIIISANPNPAIICAGSSVTLNAMGANAYSWTGGVLNNIPFSPLNNSIYTVTGTDINGCTNSASVSVIVHPNPNITATATPSFVCDGKPTTLNATGAISYTWSGGVVNNAPFIPVATSVYTVTGTDLNGCTNTAYVNVTVNANPMVSATAFPNPVCKGSSVLLTGMGANSYSWTNGVVNNVPFVPSQPNVYYVLGTDANGCTGTTSVYIAINEVLPIIINPSDAHVCNGDSLLISASGSIQYTWTGSSGLSSYNDSIAWAFPSTSSSYTVTGTDINGCTATSSVMVNVDPLVNLEITKNQDAECENRIVLLTAGGADTYEWFPATSLDNPNGSTTHATISETTVFYLKGIKGSCIGFDSILVNYYNNDENSIIIPSAFSPNADGKNDCFKIMHKAFFKKYNFVIYNRWGNKVFETDRPDECWNGGFKGVQQPIGTYYYFLSGETSCSKIFKKGDITLVK